MTKAQEVIGSLAEYRGDQLCPVCDAHASYCQRNHTWTSYDSAWSCTASCGWFEVESTVTWTPAQVALRQAEYIVPIWRDPQ